MIVYYKNNEIDREQWDNCIINSPGVKPYAYSWYLDIMAPGWEALVDDDYDSVFPVPRLKRFGIEYITTPKFLQQLGAFSPDKPMENVIVEFLDYMPGIFRLIDLRIGQNITYNGYKVTEKANFELNLSAPYEKLQAGFSSDCHRNILHSGKKKIEITDNITPEELLNLYVSNTGPNLKGIKPSDYDRLKNLMHYCLNNKKGKIIGVRAPKKRVIFGIFLVQIPGSVTMVLTANSLASRNNRTAYFVINEIIRGNALSATMLDFAGSSVPSVASFMKSFGSVNVPYYRIYRNRLFWPVRMMK